MGKLVLGCGFLLFIVYGDMYIFFSFLSLGSVGTVQYSTLGKANFIFSGVCSGETDPLGVGGLLGKLPGVCVGDQ